jgi:hypothetical protein
MNGLPFRGAVKITKHSSLRKLKRAIRRGMVPPERQVIIENAEENAQKRKEKYRPVRP